VSLTAGQGAGSGGLGGAVSITAGVGAELNGGNVVLASGAGTATSSGAVSISTADAGSGGTSGAVMIATGSSPAGSSGDISMDVGPSFYGLGGSVRINAGSTFDSSSAGGSLSLEAGSAVAGGASNGKIDVGIKHASSIELGRITNDALIRANGLVEMHTLKIGEHAHSGTMEKRLKVVTDSPGVQYLYPSAIFSFDVYLPGAAPEDLVQVSFDKAIGQMFVTGHVLQAHKVRVTVHNPGHNVVIEELPVGKFVVTCTGYTS